MINDWRVSKIDPSFKKMNEAFEEIKRYRRYLKYSPMSSYLEIAFLPLGEALGYDNHPAYMIEMLELIRDCLNEAISEKNKREKKNKGKGRK